MIRSSHLHILAYSAVIILTACTRHKYYQLPHPNVVIDPVKGVTPSSSDNIAVVEFDEHGDLFYPTQFLEARNMVAKSKKKPLVITFVHGWRHDARRNDEDLMQFKVFIDGLNEEKQKQKHGFDVKGIYIGWRGAAVEEPIPYVSDVPAVFTFWNRKAATNRMASIRLTQTLSTISGTAWKWGDGKVGRSVFMGHSFGGRILERVTTMATVAQVDEGKLVKPAADLVVLINPASESMNARVTRMALANWNEPYPLFVAIGAKNDWPNQFAWKLGYHIAPNPPTREYKVGSQGETEPQSGYLNTTVANDSRLLTHYLKPHTALQPTNVETASSGANISKGFSSNELEPFEINTNDGKRGQWKLVRAETTSARHLLPYRRAYWTFQVDSEILDGHNGDRFKGGVFGAPMTDLLHEIFAKAMLRRKRPEIEAAVASSAIAPNPPISPSANTAVRTEQKRENASADADDTKVKGS